MEEDMFYEDEDDIMDSEYMEQQMYERYLSAAAAGHHFMPPQERVPLGEQYQRCVEQLMFVRGENGMTTFEQLALLMGSCLLVLFTSCLTFLPRYVVPWTSSICGSYAVYSYFGQSSSIIYVVFGFATITYVFVYYLHSVTRKSGLGWRVGGLCFTLIVILQYLVSEKTFLQMRGVLMIMTMKIFSLASDIEAKDVRAVPDLVSFYSYCLGVTSVIFGPWMSYREHAIIMKQKQFKSVWKTVWEGLLTMLIALLCLLVSSCFAEWFIPDAYEYYTVWLIAFRDALSFRYSHYFVCYAAEGSMYLSGYLARPIDDEEPEEEGEAKEWTDGDGRGAPTNTVGPRVVRALWEADDEYPVTNPLYIELPRSLVDVVVNWNIPMHAWLKKYVFTPIRGELGYFAAVLITFAVSALLHGFNFQISAVLLSLGVYTYAEHVLREKLSKAFSACIRARRCRRGCEHVNNSWNIWVILVNFAFYLLAMFHLTYLGMVFDSSEAQEEGYDVGHTLKKWSRLNFASHYLALGTLIFAKII